MICPGKVLTFGRLYLPVTPRKTERGNDRQWRNTGVNNLTFVKDLSWNRQ